MTTTSTSRARLSIGEVLETLRADFPDITISKIRFLESEGLIEPKRSPSGYRQFSDNDVERLRYVLAAQRDRYLPLKVIKEHLQTLDSGVVPVAGNEVSASTTPHLAAVVDDSLPDADSFAPPTSDARLTRAELAAGAGLSDEEVGELESFGLLKPVDGSNHYDGNALVIAQTVGAFRQYGIEPRHLRPFKAAAEREVGLFEQVVAPLEMQRNPETRARAADVRRELAALSVRLHATLVRIGLTATPGR